MDNNLYKIIVLDQKKENQILGNINLNGTFADLSRMIWDERKDGPLPEKIEEMIGGVSVVDGKLVFDPSKKAEQDKRLVRSKRRREYLKRGLTLEKWTELLIEDDVEGQKAFREERREVKKLFPKL